MMHDGEIADGRWIALPRVPTAPGEGFTKSYRLGLTNWTSRSVDRTSMWMAGESAPTLIIC
jgi:hypothetical protein